MMTYIEAIGRGFPLVQCHCLGDGSVYEEIVWDSGAALPSKETLDSWIAANPLGTNTKITTLALRNRFSVEEKVALELAALDNPSAPMAARQQAAMLRVYMKDLDNATFVDLSRTDTRAGVQQLETYGLIATGRAAVILDTPPTEIELYKEA